MLHRKVFIVEFLSVGFCMILCHGWILDLDRIINVETAKFQTIGTNYISVLSLLLSDSRYFARMT